MPVLSCLECGATISPEAKGLCPRCLLKLGFASQLSPGFIETGAEPPPFLGFDPIDPSKRSVIEPFEFGGYRIVRLLGKGGMGAVYEAEEVASGRRVALKVLGHSLDSADTRKRFIREGRLAASINHPNSVYVYGTEEIEGAPVITMELVPGGTLHERVKEGGPMPIAEAVDAMMQIIAGLEAAHAVGILHRDIKPSNCFIEPSGTVKVGDFGLSISTLSRGDSVLTLAGSIVGTPEFSSPEQLRGEELNVRSDIYSVGMTLYFMLTGRTAFRGENVVQLLATVLDKAPQPPREIRPEIPEALSRIVLRCLSKQASERPANYDELRRALHPFTSIAPTPATLGLRFVAGAIDTVLLTLVSSFLPMMLLGDVAESVFSANGSTPTYILFIAAVLLFNIGYYAVTEGRWGATPGKRLVGLRVGGLDRNAPGIPRATLRALIYLTPSFVSAFLFRDGPVDSEAMPLTMSVTALISLYPFLLAATARRRNGFATVTDLLTKTRVIQRSAYQPRELLAPVAEPVVATESLAKIGPYHVLASIGTVGSDELILGYDMKLLRRVWIRPSPANAASVPAVVRNAARPGRLRWLQGKRDESESWDAYEAATGTPLTALLKEPQPWKNVRHWLHDLAVELDVAARDGSMLSVLSLDRAWITADGGAKLLDFPAPGSTPVAHVDTGIFLNQVAMSALEGRIASESDARTRTVQLPTSLGARDALRALRDAPFGALAQQLKDLLQQVPHITRLRRFGLVAGCVAPALFISLFMAASLRMLEKGQRESPEVMPLRNALIIHSVVRNLDITASKDPAVRVYSAEILIADRFGKFIRDPKAWNSQIASAMIPGKMRTEAERIAVTYPAPEPQEVEQARTILRPLLDSQGNLNLARHRDGGQVVPSAVVNLNVTAPVIDVHRSSPIVTEGASQQEASGKAGGGLGQSDRQDRGGDILAIPTVWVFSSGVMLWAVVFSIGAAVLFRGGLLMRALGIGVVRSDGSDASRWRMLWRACIAWCWLPIAAMLILWLNRSGYQRTSVAIVGLPILCLVIWSAADPRRSLPDRFAGTWLVPR